MNKSWKRKWLEALRNGKYKQGKEALRIKDKYCCLGVLCEIAKNSKYVNWYIGPDGNYIVSHPDTREEDAIKPKEYLGKDVRTMFGITSRQEGTLANFNDGFRTQRRRSFNKIADWIETNL